MITNTPLTYEEYARRANHWLANARRQDSIDRERLSVRVAQVFATLAQAAATADLATRGIEPHPADDPGAGR